MAAKTKKHPGYYPARRANANAEWLRCQPLTIWQRRVLATIWSYTKRRTYSPTLAELAKILGLAGHASGVLTVIDILIKRGYLLNVPCKARTLYLSKKGVHEVTSLPVRTEL